MGEKTGIDEISIQAQVNRILDNRLPDALASVESQLKSVDAAEIGPAMENNMRSCW